MASESSEARLKQIRIKTGVVKRLHKEYKSYETEASVEQLRLDNLKEENRGANEITHQEQVLKETLNMIPESKKRFETAYHDLKSLIQESEDLCDNDLYKAAIELLDTIRI